MDALRAVRAVRARDLQRGRKASWSWVRRRSSSSSLSGSRPLDATGGRAQIDSLIALGFAERGLDGEARTTELGKEVWFEISDTAGAPDVPPRAGIEPDARAL